MGRSLQLLNQLGGKSSSLLIPKCKFLLSSSPLSLFTAQSLLSGERQKQMPAVLSTPVVLIAKTKRITSATRHPSSNIMRSAMWSMILLLMRLRLKSVSMLSSLTAKKNINKFITTLTLLVMTPRLLVNITQATMGTVDTTSVLLTPAINITVKTRRKCSARNTQRKTLARSPSRSVRRLWTLIILKLVRRGSIHTARRLLKSLTTAHALWDMNHIKWLMVTMMVMEVTTRWLLEL